MKRQMEKDDQLRCCCNFHPDEVFVGVCPLCLYERLTVVASKRCRHGFRLNKSSSCKSSKPRIVLPKIFAIDSLIHRKNKKHFLDLKDSESRSNDESFISIRFDDNNSVGAWEKGKDCKSVVEHAKQPQWTSVRWRKQVRHIFQLVTWKKSSLHTESGKVAKGGQWIRNLTKRKITIR